MRFIERKTCEGEIRGERRTGEARRAIRLKRISDLTPYRGEGKGRLGGRVLDFSAVLREFYKASVLDRKLSVRVVPQLPETHLP